MKHRPSSAIRSERRTPAWASLASVALAAFACQSSPGVHAGPGPTHATARAPSPPVPTPVPSDVKRAPQEIAKNGPAPNLEFVEAVVGGASQGDSLPLIVALHGLGDRPDAFIGVFNGFPAKARIVAPHSATPMGEGFAWFKPFSPMADEAAPAIAQAADDVATFVTRITALRPTQGKALIVGFSQGGALSYAVAARHSEVVGAAFPIGGWLPPPLWPTSAPPRAPPIYAFHGTVDNRVPIERDRAGAKRLEELGFPVRFMEAEGVAHAIPPSVRMPLFAALAAECDHQSGRK